MVFGYTGRSHTKAALNRKDGRNEWNGGISAWSGRVITIKYVCR